MPKKSSGVLREGVAAKYACIAHHQGVFPVALMCRVLGVSRTGFYAAQRRAPSARAGADERLQVEIRVVHAASRRTSGGPRVHAALRAQGVRGSRTRVARLMREAGVAGRRRRRGRRTTDSRHGEPVAANVLARQFGVETVAAPDRIWAGDITYVPTREGWLYLAVLLDLASRRVIGWTLRHTLERARELYLKSGNRCVFPGCRQVMMNTEGVFVGEVCHIEAAEPRGPRFNPTRTNEQRRAFANLTLMCHEHHKVTDDADKYTVEVLKQIKKEHEAKFVDIPLKIQSSLRDRTEDDQVWHARTLARMRAVLNWTASTEPFVDDAVEEVNKFGDRLKRLPPVPGSSCRWLTSCACTGSSTLTRATQAGRSLCF